MSSRNHHDQQVIKSGYLKKLKTSRKKFFVLRGETAKTPARLEYYDSEKKFLGGHNPKRSIPLKTCFNINKNQFDAKHRHVVALYTKDDVFSVAFDGEEDLEAWYKALLALQRGEDVIDGKVPKPTFEHVWQVTIAKRGLGGNLFPETSVYRLCLTDKVLSLIRKDSTEPQLELSLSSIRSCGNLKTFFYLEIGRSSALGAGELWMETEDAYIAQNVHATVFHAMSTNSSSREELGPKSRTRSSSATESSKPTNVGRRQNQPNPICGVVKPIPHIQDTTFQNAAEVQLHAPPYQPSVNELSCMYQRSKKASERRHSVSAAGGAAWSGTINHQRTRSLPLAHPAPSNDHISHPPRAAKRTTNQSSKCFSGSGGGRERCDSMPSRARTTSEGNHFISIFNRPHFRPPSLYKESPSGSPVSPPSAAGSTDSAGSSLSIDEPDNTWTDTNDVLRYSHSLTPDEAIAEENFEDCPDGNFIMRLVGNNSYIPMNLGTTDDGYVKMQSRNQHMSPTASLSSVTSGTPSTDMKFAEYTLEKVPSYFTPSEDDETSSTDRPTRAYSFGSHPDSYKYRSMQADAARERAYSFGAKTKKMQRIFQHPQANSGSKSSSAPLLSNSRVNSHGSSDPMNDLMEIDFSKSKENKTNRVPPGYVEMKPGSLENNRINRNGGGGEDVTGTSGYVDMKCGRSPGKSSTIYYVKRNSPPKSTGYMEMDPRKKMATSPLSPSFLPGTSDYMDMNVAKKTPRVQLTSFARYSGHHDDSTPSSIEFIDEDEPKPKSHGSDGYVEMNVGKSTSSHQRQSSLDSAKINVGDYTNMSCGIPSSTMTSVTPSSSSSSSKKRERKLGNRSQPIQIQGNGSSQFPKSSSPSNPLLYGRKYSTGTPPKMFLNLNTSSLPRQKSKKVSVRRDSKDSSSSSVTTPSSSSTIFPISINSPCSPVKPPVEASDAYTSMDFTRSSPKNGNEYVNYNPAKTRQQESGGDYALMKPSNSSVLVVPLSTMNLVESKCFRPIPETNESRTTSPRQSIDVGKSPESPKNSRSNSINGDGAGSEVTLPSVSRPSSTSSELNSVTSTIVGSRPSSVNSDLVRPPSVSSELCYASLDLEDGGSKSPRTVKPQTQTSSEGVAPSQPDQDPSFTYAKIDFVKSEGFRHNPLLPNNAKVKH